MEHGTLMMIVEKQISAWEKSFTSNDSRGPQQHTAAAALFVNDGQLKCTYCRQNHSSSSCTFVTDITQRKAILKRTGRCFVCLRRHHLSRDCHSPAKCARCGGRHHTSICKNGHTGSQGSSTQQRPHSLSHVSLTQQTWTPSQLAAGYSASIATTYLTVWFTITATTKYITATATIASTDSCCWATTHSNYTTFFVWRRKCLYCCRQQKLMCLTWINQSVGWLLD